MRAVRAGWEKGAASTGCALESNMTECVSAWALHAGAPDAARTARHDGI
jgi:hypothetical protein